MFMRSLNMISLGTCNPSCGLAFRMKMFVFWVTYSSSFECRKHQLLVLYVNMDTVKPP